MDGAPPDAPEQVQQQPEDEVLEGEATDEAAPSFLFFGGMSAEELGTPHGVQEINSRLAGYEKHMNERLAELEQRIADLDQHYSARLAAIKNAVERGIGVNIEG